MLSALLERRSEKVDPIHPRDPGLASLFGFGQRTRAKVDVSEESAMKFGAVYAAIRIIAETSASLPIKVFERQSGGRKAEVTQHPVRHVLQVEPNREQTPMTAREFLAAQVLGWGNGYGELEFNNRMEIAGWRPRRSAAVRCLRDKAGNIVYEVTPSDGGNYRLQRDEIIHVLGLGGDGLLGWSPIRLAAESIGVGLAAERTAGLFFGQAARPSGAISLEGELSELAYARLKESVTEQMSAENIHKPLLLEGGGKWEMMSMPMNEAQFLETRKFQVIDVARLYRIPPHMLAEMDKATFSNIEQQSLDFEKHTMRPWLVRLEQEYNRKLFSRRQRGRFYCKHIVEGLLRGDIKTRFEAYKTAVINGWMNRDEVREREDMNPIENGLGKIYLVPVNMQSAEKLDQDEPPPEPPRLPAPPADEQETENEEEQQESDDEQRDNSYLRKLLEQTVGSLIGIEATRATRAADKPGQFLAWLDEFYTEQRGRMLARLGEEFAPLIDAHLTESRSALLEASGRATADNLTEIISRTVADWETTNRAGDLAGQILEKQTHARQ